MLSLLLELDLLLEGYWCKHFKLPSFVLLSTSLGGATLTLANYAICCCKALWAYTHPNPGNPLPCPHATVCAGLLHAKVLTQVPL